MCLALIDLCISNILSASQISTSVNLSHNILKVLKKVFDMPFIKNKRYYFFKNTHTFNIFYLII